MTDVVRPNWLLTEDQLIDWLAQESRTYGWDVLIALDRDKTNHLLLQEYIARYDKGNHFKPITRSIQTSEGAVLVWEYLYDHVLGPPRLSFEVSRVFDDLARLTMPVMGGTQLTVQQYGATKHASRIDVFDPLRGPRVICEIRLEDTDGSLIDDNRVKLNLRMGTNFRLTFGTTYQGQMDGGNLYKQIFDELPEDDKYFVISTIKDYDGSELIRPDRFRLRGLSAQPGKSDGEPGTKEGAVLIFTGQEGSGGNLPDPGAEWVYPIPQGSSSTLLIKNSLIMKRFVEMGFEGAGFANIRMQLDDEDDPAEARAIEGALGFWDMEVEHPDSGVSHAFWQYTKFDDDNQFGIVRNDEEFRFRWQGRWRFPGTDIWTMGYWRSAPLEPSIAYDCDWNLDLTFRCIIGQDGNVAFVDAGAGNIEFNVRTIFDSPVFDGHEEYMAQKYKELMVGRMAALVGDCLSTVREVDYFRLYSLMFSSDKAITHQAVRIPRDMVIFGKVSPSITSFEVVPMERDIGAGESFAFMLEPAQPGAQWSVERVPGYDGGLGSISQNGVYRAPAASEFSGVYTMVRVLAVSGDNTSTSLVRVVIRSVSVNTLVVAVNPDGGKVRLSAGSLDGMALDWSVSSSTGGTLTDEPPDSLAEFDDGDMFYVPGPDKTGVFFSVDEVTVTNPRTGASAGSVLLILEKAPNATVTVDSGSGLPEGKLQLQMGIGEGPFEGVTWTVVAGGGVVDEDGVYTVDPASKDPFAVITGQLNFGSGINFNGYMIMPVPLIDLEEMQRILS